MPNVCEVVWRGRSGRIEVERSTLANGSTSKAILRWWASPAREPGGPPPARTPFETWEAAAAHVGAPASRVPFAFDAAVRVTLGELQKTDPKWTLRELSLRLGGLRHALQERRTRDTAVGTLREFMRGVRDQGWLGEGRELEITIRADGVRCYVRSTVDVDPAEREIVDVAEVAPALVTP